MPDLASFLAKACYSTEDLRRIVVILRAPGGCPWDAKQTHESIKKNFIEETYEAIEGINKHDDTLLCEELGDVLLQVALHTQIAQDRGVFGWDNVTDGICRKLIERHPHVFGEAQVTGIDNVLSNWDTIKRKSKGQDRFADAMAHVPRELPALMRAQKLEQKAAKAGFGRHDVWGALAKLEEEVRALREAIAEDDAAHCKKELGDVLFCACNVGKFLHCDAEEALTQASDKFLARFTFVEESVRAQGRNLRDCSDELLDKLWEQAKDRLREPHLST
jgi:tetrapyrrole methylase family protein/MazG family protein